MDGCAEKWEAQADLGPGEALVEGEKSGGDVPSAALQPSHRSLGGARLDGERTQQEDCKPDEANTHGRSEGLAIKQIYENQICRKC